MVKLEKRVTDRKFKPQSSSIVYILNPPSSKTTLCSHPPTINFTAKTAFVRCSQRCDARNRRKIHIAYNLDLEDHTTHRTKPEPDPHFSPLRIMCHLYSARLPPQCLVELQFRGRLSIQVHSAHWQSQT